MLRRLTLILFLYMFVMACGGDASQSINDAPAMHQSDEAVSPSPASCVNSLKVNEALPERLSQTGLYNDIESKEVNEALWAFEPEYQLWSDDAAKERWIYVPECESIDTSNMNDWSFPVGTRFFKEFMVDGQRIETRLIERVGDGAYDFLYGTYQWNDSETEATLVPPEGLKEAKGTTHDIPSESQCRQCHGSYEYRGGRPSRALGFSALLLNHDSAGVSLSDLVAQGRLTHAPDSALQIPGTDLERDALGYLHVNCGVCHNNTRDGVPQTDMNLWIDVDQRNVAETAPYLTTVGQANKIFNDQHVSARIEPGQPDLSSIIYRMSQRGNNAQMPPLASKKADEAGIDAVKTWILSLP